MAGEAPTQWLDRPVDTSIDHFLGLPDAEITLVEYGSYDCSHCRAAHKRIANLRDEFGDRLLYVFRHRPLPGSKIALRAARLVERSAAPRTFWKAHVALMSRSPELTESDLEEVTKELGLDLLPRFTDRAATRRVDSDIKSAKASGVTFTPAFFINGRRYDGPWDDASFSEALMAPLGHRVRTAALDFVNWPASTGILLLLATVAAVILSNSGYASAFAALWTREAGFMWNGHGFVLPLLRWVNDGLLTIFFLVVGLEIKREFTTGHLSSRQLAAMPIAAAIGGMVVPALLYVTIVPPGPWTIGWGVPIATDTAFAVALIAVLGRRVPIELRIFLTAAAIVDDIAAIGVVALFYSSGLHFGYLAAALAIVGLLAWFNRIGVFRVAPYALLGIALWFCIHEGGVHATLAGVILALFIPTRSPPDFQALLVQADALVTAEMQRADEMRHALSSRTLRSLDAIYERLESPAARMLRIVELRSSYIVLPIFALANAGVTIAPGLIDGRGGLVAAIIAGLVVGKPVGMLAVSYLAVKMKLAEKPAEYDWLQVAGAGCLGGIGFTMSLFIAGQAFPVPADFDAAKIAIFAASIFAAVLGVGTLWWAGSDKRRDAGG